MKKFIILALAVVLLSQGTSSVSASEPSPELIFNSKHHFDFHIPPFKENGVTMVEAKPVLEKLNYKVTYDTKYKYLTAEKNYSTVYIDLTDGKARSKHSLFRKDVGAKLIDNHVVVSLRYLADISGSQLEWNAGSNVIYINNNNVLDITQEEMDRPYEYTPVIWEDENYNTFTSRYYEDLILGVGKLNK